MNRCSQCTLAHYLHMMVGAAADCHFMLSMECGDLSPLLEFWMFGDESGGATQPSLAYQNPKAATSRSTPKSRVLTLITAGLRRDHRNARQRGFRIVVERF